MGGEKGSGSVPSSIPLGSPPHGRGKGFWLGAVLYTAGITPAWAGKRAIWSRSAKKSKDHPRMGGEKHIWLTSGRQWMGSPPHGRGKDLDAPTANISPRITPAWAGKRNLDNESVGKRQDHPRMGGEKQFVPAFSVYVSGSPPHGRGKVEAAAEKLGVERITPAWAGKRFLIIIALRSTQDHPRMGGEKQFVPAFSVYVSGSPPHGRGKVEAAAEKLGVERITPAWAGKRFLIIIALRSTQDHPRMGGEKPLFRVIG